MASVVELLDRKYDAGTRVMNCVVHGGDLTDRPDDCRLCLADLRNQLTYCVSVNKWLNTWKEDAERILQERI